jgi:2-polyprenyl-3-methyl-5-hydroxy-6-metoxy-1,4-benzoquinol methylase
MYDLLERINHHPKPFEFYTAKDLWADDYISSQMLSFHLNGNNDHAIRNTSFIDRSVDWIIPRFNIHECKSIADFGCGPGLYTEHLAKMNAAVTGIDLSRKSIEYVRNKAKQEKLNTDYINQDYLEFVIERRFDLIIMI